MPGETLGAMTVGKLLHLIGVGDATCEEKVRTDTQVVVSFRDPETGETRTYELLPVVGTGWLPSNVLELHIGKFISG